MHKNLIKAFISIVLTFITIAGIAQSDWNNTSSASDVSRDTLSKNGYTLVFINKDSSFDKVVQQNMINTFFSVYPEEVKTFNHHSLKNITIIIDPGYKGVAATDNGIVRVNPEWMHKHPQDIDVITHEVMHIVQAYPCLLYTSPSPRDRQKSRMPSSA